MPQIILYNTRENDDRTKIEAVIDEVFRLLVIDLGIDPVKHLTYSFLSGGRRDGVEVPLKIVVEGLSKKPERTLDVRKRLSHGISKACALATQRKVETWIRSLDAEEGAYSSA